MSLELTDRGRRYDHYVELLELWQDTLLVMEGHRWQSDKTIEKKLELTAAIRILQKQIDVLAEYEDATLKLRRVINDATASQENLEGLRPEPLRESLSDEGSDEA